MSEAEVLFETRGRIGLITLNRPKALNALTHGMVEAMSPQLARWADDPAVAAVAVQGAGERAFCAGGDIRRLHDEGRAGGDYPARFYADEYRLNAQIKTYPKPYVALIDGIAMGGGVGVSVHGSHRVVTEHALFAMPETGIGFFPDVGGSWFLPRLPGQIGLWLALTGARIKAADMAHAGIATQFTPRADLSAMIDRLAETGDADAALRAFAADPGPAPLSANRAVIDRCFGENSLAAILKGLEAEGTPFAREAADAIAARAPLSLRVALRQNREGARLTFADCMTMEYRLALRFMEGHDFYEGVRAAVIDKDQKPAWNPAALSAVTDAQVDAYFAPLNERELVLSR